MGVIKKLIDSFDQTDAKLAEQKEAVRAMEELGKSKAEVFIRDIALSLLSAGDEKSNKTVPITFVVGSKKEVRAFSSSEVANIGGVVNNALTSFLSGKKENIINGVGNLINSALSIFLGEGEAASDSVEMYYVTTDGLSPVRIDLKSWYYSASASSITSKLEKIVVVVVTKSVIDVSRIDLGTFLYLYRGQFDVDTMTQEQLKTAISEASDVYNVFVERSIACNKISQNRANTPEVVKMQFAKTVGVVNKSSDNEIAFVDDRPKLY